MTEQEAFDTAVRGLASQGFTRSARPKTDSDSSTCGATVCLFNSPDGKKHCAFGWLITDVDLSAIKTDEGYDGNGLTAYAVMHHVPAIRERFAGFNPVTNLDSFHDALQNCHDTAYSADGDQVTDRPLRMIQKLREFAENYGLSRTVLDEAAAKIV